MNPRNDKPECFDGVAAADRFTAAMKKIVSVPPDRAAAIRSAASGLVLAGELRDRLGNVVLPSQTLPRHPPTRHAVDRPLEAVPVLPVPLVEAVRLLV